VISQIKFHQEAVPEGAQEEEADDGIPSSRKNKERKHDFN